MLRWKLKKSIPFEADETVISYMRQPAREEGVDIVTALARLRIIREYEALAEAANLHPGVILSSSLAAISLLDGEKADGLITRVFRASRNDERDQPPGAWTAEFVRKARTIIDARCSN